jgi:hypothetical protein
MQGITYDGMMSRLFILFLYSAGNTNDFKNQSNRSKRLNLYIESTGLKRETFFNLKRRRTIGGTTNTCPSLRSL